MITEVARFVEGLLTFLFSGSIGTRKSKSVENRAQELSRSGNKLFDPSRYQTTDTWEYSVNTALNMMNDHHVDASPELLRAVSDCIEHLVISNGIFPPTITWESVDHEGDEGFRLRRYLERHKRFHETFPVNDHRFHLGLNAMFGSVFGALQSLPISQMEGSGFGVKLGEMIPDTYQAIDAIVGYSFDADLQRARLFEDLRNQFERNVFSVSGVDYNNQPSNPHRYTMPRDYSGSRENLFEGYLSGTPFKALLDTPLPFAIPTKARFEHTHIVGGTGQGKTQLLSHFILQDLNEMRAGKRKSIVLIDSQGDFIDRISSLGMFDPRDTNGLADKLVIIDPSDVSYPTALNIFAINKERLKRYGPVERERTFNAAVELYEHFFQGLLGSELTAKQGVAFTYMARMMLEFEDATIFTLADLMENPHSFKDKVAGLSPSTKRFFETQLLSKSYNQTRNQIVQRLWGVLSVPAFERMFGQSEHKVDLFELMNSGSVILINTSKDLLKTEGSAIFGKFFLAAIAQAIGERSVLKEEDRTETIIYLDEAHEYADASLEVLLNQGRKYKGGVVIAHQFLDQLSQGPKQNLLSNASVKIVGGLSHSDNQTFAREMDTTTDFLASLRKRESGTEFGLWIKHVIPHTLRLAVPFGPFDNEPVLDGEGQQLLKMQNRERYCVPAALTQIRFQPIAEAKEAEIPVLPIQEGRGGSQHRDIQQKIKAIGHDLGFGASVEASCTQSEGAIDVLLTGEKTTIAVEVSVTTSPEHELQNLKKCLAEPVDQILCVAPNDVHRLAIQNLCIEKLPQTQFDRITFLNPSSVNEYLTQFDERETTLIRGYEVIVRTQKSDPRDVEYRKSRIRQVLDGKLK